MRLIAVRDFATASVAYLLETGPTPGAPAGVHNGRVYEPDRQQLGAELLVASIAARGGWVPIEELPLPAEAAARIEQDAAAAATNPVR